MLRWTSPVTHMARTATTDVEIRGQLIREGEVVVMLYGSANRDEEIFGPDPRGVRHHPTSQPAHRVRLRRTCLPRARNWRGWRQRCMFEVLLGRFPKIELAGEVDRMRATMVPGVKRMPVRLGA